MPRYGQPRDGSLVLIYVTEDLSDSLRVKADTGRHPPTDVYPVLKLNAVRKFQTGIYDYSVMTSVFARVDFAPTERPFPLRKVSLSSQEWCGHVYHQVVPQGPAAASSLPGTQWLSTSHSYFDGEADEQRALPVPVGAGPAVAEDELPILLRSYAQRPDFLAPGEHRTVTFLPSLIRARLLHKPLAFTEAQISRLADCAADQDPGGGVLGIYLHGQHPRWRPRDLPLRGEPAAPPGPLPLGQRRRGHAARLDAAALLAAPRQWPGGAAQAARAGGAG